MSEFIADFSNQIALMPFMNIDQAQRECSFYPRGEGADGRSAAIEQLICGGRLDHEPPKGVRKLLIEQGCPDQRSATIGLVLKLLQECREIFEVLFSHRARYFSPFYNSPGNRAIRRDPTACGASAMSQL